MKRISFLFVFLFLCFSLPKAMAQLPNLSSGKIIRYQDFASAYLPAHTVDVWLPDHFSEKEKYAVLYMHDGKSLFDSSIMWNNQEWGVDEVASKLMKEKNTKQFIVVGIWNGNQKRHSEYFPQKPFESLSKQAQDSIYQANRASGQSVFAGPINSDDYLKFIVKELKPFIDKNYPTLPDANNCFVAGSSMGGLISMYAICEYPDVFGGAACISTHWPGIFDSKQNPIPATFIKYLQKHLPNPINHKIYFDYGDQTLDAMYPPYQAMVDKVMEEKGYVRNKNWVTEFFPGADHSERSWNKRLHIPFQFLLANPFAVFAYYAGNKDQIANYPVEKITHLSYSFTHLKGAKNSLGSLNDTLTLAACVAQKKRNPNLKVILSMGGWTGCYSCSEVFSKDSARKLFASSTKDLITYFGADGIDLDWEYPTIPGAPNHPFSVNDKSNFTSLIQTLRDTLGAHKEISFAAGGFGKYINEAVDWQQLIPLVDRINLMTYDLISGYDTITGHHSGLYSTHFQKESCNNAVQMLAAKQVPLNKLLIGAAFYARIWENVSSNNNGLYEKGKFLRGVSFNQQAKFLSADSGFVYHWDEEASAPFLYHAQKKWFVTFDNPRSVALKTKYSLQHKLNGMMFWQLAEDSYQNGLLATIDEEIKLSHAK